MSVPSCIKTSNIQFKSVVQHSEEGGFESHRLHWERENEKYIYIIVTYKLG